MKTLTFNNANALRKITIGAAAVGLLLSAQFSLAGKPTEYPPLECTYVGMSVPACGTELSDLCDAIYGSSETLSQRTKNGLMTKVFDAEDKLGQEKVEDAIQKLDDIDTKIHALDDAKKPKIDEGDFANIHTSLEAAQDCVAGL